MELSTRAKDTSDLGTDADAEDEEMQNPRVVKAPMRLIEELSPHQDTRTGQDNRKPQRSWWPMLRHRQSCQGSPAFGLQSQGNSSHSICCIVNYLQP